MRKILLGFAGALTALVAGAVAQEDEAPSQRQMMLAAGYKAMFTCSGLFNGGKTLDQVAAHELDHIYPDYEPAMVLLPDAVVDSDNMTVSVTYQDGEPPRISVWRIGAGCVALPPGSSLMDSDETYAEETVIIRRESGRSPDNIAWPSGDDVPASALPGNQKEALARSAAAAFDGDYNGRTTAVVVVEDGQIVHEQYLEGFDEYTSQRTWSVAKSVAATVIGAAVEQGILDVSDPAGIPEWQNDGDPRQEVTIENLLHMASGLDSGVAGNRTDDVYFGGGLVANHATRGALEATPGVRWKYANNDTMLVLRALRARINDDAYSAFPFDAVLDKIGMRNTVPETDWGGDYVMSSQVWTTARDLARLGLLYLNDGVWNGERILPEGWAEYVSTPAPAQPPCNTPDTGCRGYGAQFWLAKGYPGVPDDTYMALGNRGQFVFIIPSRDVVIVRRGYDWRGNYFDGPAFVADVLEALE